jgi:hypothetical protein
VMVNIESQKGCFFDFDHIPWDTLAFPSTRNVLLSYINRSK